MKRLVLLFLLWPCLAWAQYDCGEDYNHTAIGVSYILPKSVSVEATYFTNIGITAGIGVAYTVAGQAKQKIENGIAAQPNLLDMFAYLGYRVVQIDYKFSAFLNAGGTLGDVNTLQPFFSAKLLFPAGQKAFSIEPFYVLNRGLSGRATIYFKL